MKSPGTKASLGKLVAFVSTTDADRARTFYESVLGMRLVSDDDFAVVFDAHGTTLRITKVESLAAAPFTVLGRFKDPDGNLLSITEQAKP